MIKDVFYFGDEKFSVYRVSTHAFLRVSDTVRELFLLPNYLQTNFQKSSQLLRVKQSLLLPRIWVLYNEHSQQKRKKKSSYIRTHLQPTVWMGKALRKAWKEFTPFTQSVSQKYNRKLTPFYTEKCTSTWLTYSGSVHPQIIVLFLSKAFVHHGI